MLSNTLLAFAPLRFKQFFLLTVQPVGNLLKKLTVLLFCTIGFCRPVIPQSTLVEIQVQNATGVDLAALGIKVTSGAAPGFVPDRMCGMCHREIYASYQDVGMAQSFFRPTSSRKIEDFENNRYYHRPSQIYYEMTWEGGRLWYKQYQLDESAEPINVYKRRVDWILGSGTHSRTYLYQTEIGELFQFPIAWYSQSQSWRMAPGFDRDDHLGLMRRVTRECLFCHNAYPDVPRGSDAYGKVPLFPGELPQGIGCQRCHGPGAEHVRASFADGTDIERIRSLIVNPSRLSAKLRNDVCFQCHMQPSVTLIGVRRFGRNDFSFLAGQSLDEYQVRIDTVEKEKSPSERFEINHHPYRLQQSRCWIESGGKLSCLTCHDPHRRVAPDKKTAHFRTACLSCHQTKHCRGFDSSPTGVPADADCLSCHMVKRRTQDVVHVVMTDHLIRRRPPLDDEFLKPLEEREPVLVDAVILSDLGENATRDRDLYRATTIVRAAAVKTAVRKLGRILGGRDDPPLEPHLDLVRGLIKQHEFEQALSESSKILADHPGHALTTESQALALAGSGRMDEAIERFREAAELNPVRAEANFNLGRILLGRNRTKEAISYLRRATEIRPEMAQAWFHLGVASARMSRSDDAIRCLKRALELDPRLSRPYLAIANEWAKVGKVDEAIRYLRHGLHVANRKEKIAAALKDLAEETGRIETGPP